MGILRVEGRPGVLGWDVEAVSRESSLGASAKKEEDFHPTQISSYLLSTQMYWV